MEYVGLGDDSGRIDPGVESYGVGFAIWGDRMEKEPIRICERRRID